MTLQILCHFCHFYVGIVLAMVALVQMWFLSYVGALLCVGIGDVGRLV